MSLAKEVWRARCTTCCKIYLHLSTQSCRHGFVLLSFMLKPITVSESLMVLATVSSTLCPTFSRVANGFMHTKGRRDASMRSEG
eukprot:6462022-Amphidinium_carterae.2